MSDMEGDAPAPGLEDADSLFGELSAASLQAAAQAQQAAAAKEAGGALAGQAPGQPRQLKPEEFKHYACIYPCYLNPKLTMAQGRRLPLHMLAGCDDPWPMDIAEACGALGFRAMVIENNKRHPRDQFSLTTPPQRLRVEIKTADGTPVVPSIATKEALLRKVAPLLPALPGRRHRLEQMARQREMILAQQRAAAAAAPKAASASPAKSAKKEDKKAAKKKK